MTPHKNKTNLSESATYCALYLFLVYDVCESGDNMSWEELTDCFVIGKNTQQDHAT
jgi:hypothetical protein